MLSSAYNFLIVLCMFMVAMIMFPAPISGGISEQRLRWVPKTTTPCQGSIEECIAEGEVGIETESHRRILATSQYISYKALQRNSVPCSRKGASYYNCKPGAEANPYSRGCPAITRCRNS
ncbi:hypothetical protein RJT34_19410 [Clitoria ternatea]|uniref:Rapid ALkalinization Factor n=1 Tax=Clitoria ternatea TaxID=43366 RepID=A0AAN9P3N4_CLITE